MENALSCHIPSEGVILDTLRIIDEWPMIKQKIPPVDYCPVTIMPLTEEIVKKYSLGAVDMHIFDLIDEKRSVESIVRQSLEPPFEALSSLVRLIDTGLVEVFPQGTKEIRDSSIARRILLTKIKRVSSYVLLVLTAGIFPGRAEDIHRHRHSQGDHGLYPTSRNWRRTMPGGDIASGLDTVLIPVCPHLHGSEGHVDKARQLLPAVVQSASQGVNTRSGA